MKAITNLISVILISFLFSPLTGIAQNNIESNLPFDTKIVYPYISISKDQLVKAETLEDLNYRYKSSWVEQFNSVAITTLQNGKSKTEISSNDQLTKKQKELMIQADEGAEIHVLINYIPNNTLTLKEEKQIDFTIEIDPFKNAAFIGGHSQLKKYVTNHITSKIPEGTFKGFDLTVITFNVNPEGEITNSKIAVSSNDEETDQFILKNISSMPCWIPAEYAKGTKVDQTVAITIGNNKNCMINTLNFKQFTD